MNTVHYSIVLLVVAIIVLVVIYRIRFNRGKKQIKDWIIVEHKGTSLPMTPEQKCNQWDGLTPSQKDRHARMVRTKVANGTLVAIKNDEGIFYVHPDSRAAQDFEHVWVGKFSDRIKQKRKRK